MKIKQANPPLLSVNNLTIEVAGIPLADKINFSVLEKDVFLIVGPNGAGKSTLIKGISQTIPYSGDVLFQGKSMREMSKKEIAKCIGVLAQHQEVNYAYTVEEIVELGRYSYRKNWFAMSKEDKDYVEEALEMTGLLEKRSQSVLTLSGGEIQRTFLAQLFAQNPKLLILDEPTNHLDLQYQQQIFGLIQQWLKMKNKAVIAVIHDLSLASYLGNRFLLMNQGNEVACGEKEYVLTPKRLNKVYRMDVGQWLQNLFQHWQDIFKEE